VSTHTCLKIVLWNPLNTVWKKGVKEEI
jgi:hypothetical protein